MAHSFKPKRKLNDEHKKKAQAITHFNTKYMIPSNVVMRKGFRRLMGT
jgi:hypothetical protein